MGYSNCNDVTGSQNIVRLIGECLRSKSFRGRRHNAGKPPVPNHLISEKLDDVQSRTHGVMLNPWVRNSKPVPAAPDTRGS
jgi:hypothetical protein